MRVKTTLIVICFVSVLAMAIGAPSTPNRKSNKKQGKSGDRKKNRRTEEERMRETAAIPDTRERVEAERSASEEDPLLAFTFLDANGDDVITKKEYKLYNTNGQTKVVFKTLDTNEDKQISLEEYMAYHSRDRSATVRCDTFAMENCASKFSNHLRTQEERLDVSTLSSNGLFCTALQIYVNCIGHERNLCRNLETYAQRIKRTSIAYRNAGICPLLNTTSFNAPNVNLKRRRRLVDSGLGETRRRSRGSRHVRAAKRTPLTNEDCLRNAFASCHEDLYDLMAVRSRGCTITKKYRTCIKKSTKRCRDKSYVNKIMSGLKYIRKAHRDKQMCGLQT